MERFKKYLGKELNLEKAKDDSFLDSIGINCTYLPEPLEDIDELEFRAVFDGQVIVLTVVTELGKVKRAMFGAADSKHSDVLKSLTPEQLEKFLAEQGDDLLRFFDHLTAF